MSDQLTLFAAPPVDPRYDHVWAWGRPSKALPPYEPQRKGRRCRVVCRATPRRIFLLPGNPCIDETLNAKVGYLPNKSGKLRLTYGEGTAPLNVAVELSDGELVCAPRWAVRRVR